MENLVPHQDSIPGPSCPYRAAITTELSWSKGHVEGKEMCVKLRSESVKETAHLEDIGVDGDTIKMEFMEGGYEAFTMWLRTENSSGMLLTGR